MLGGGQLVVRKQPAAGLDVREAAARLVLKEAHKQGHAYVELREAGGKKRTSIFFCTLCLTQCFSDSALWDHLGGGPHSRKLAAAKPTLFGPLPWPFRDGVLFFGREDSPVDEKRFASPRTPLQLNAPLPLSCIAAAGCPDHVASPELSSGEDGDSDDSRDSDYTCPSRKTIEDSAMKKKLPLRPGKRNGGCRKKNGGEGILICKDSLTIHDVLMGEKIDHLKIRSIGIGHISAGICRPKQDDGNGVACRIWCAWLGEGETANTIVLSTAQDCEFAIVNFSYTLELGRRGNTCDFNNFFLDDGEERESEEEDDTNSSSSRKKQKKSASSSSDVEENSMGQNELSGSCSPEYSLGSNSSASSIVSKSTKEGKIQCSRRLLSDKVMRRELRQRERLAAERACGICRQKMLPGKDVAALLNLRTGKLSCSSRNTNGAFHVFHISCLIQWTLLCEFEMWRNGKITKTRGRKAKRPTRRRISSIFCPECQGTGVHVKGDELEHPTIPLSEMFHYELRSIQAHKSWMEDPEPLDSCSTGLYLHCEESLEGKPPPSKLLHFFRAD